MNNVTDLTIHILTKSQFTNSKDLDLFLNSASLMMARSFEHNCLYHMFSTDDKKRLEIIQWWMKTTIKYGLRFGEVYYVGKEPLGLVVWLPPNKRFINIFYGFIFGFYKAFFKFSFLTFKRMYQILNQWHIAQLNKPPHWYLTIIAVDPVSQGKGIGRLLIEKISNKANLDGFPCYLETTDETNINFYKKLGWKIIDELVYTDKDFSLTTWTMIKNGIK